MDKHHLLNEADARLYRAKASGRNCVMPTIKLKSKGPKLIKTAYEVLSTSEA
jgi:hypothetical protein